MKQGQQSLIACIQKLILAMVKPYKFYVLLFLIGAAGSLWTVSGTLPTLLFFLLKYLPEYGFFAFVFLASWGMTLIIGSALGTASVVGVLFISIARAAGLPAPLVAGAVLSGIYLGERTSPMSSCANLVSELTGVPINDYIKYNWRSLLAPVCFTLLLYTILSLQMPMKGVSLSILEKLQIDFLISPWTLLPIFVLVICLTLKIELIPALLLSLLTSASFSVLYGHENLLMLVRTGLNGYTADSALHFLNSKGSFGMLKSVMIIAVATGFNELLRLSTFYNFVQNWLKKLAHKKSRYLATFFSSIFGSLIGFSQTVAILITYEMTRDLYEDSPEDRIQHSLDIANSAVLTPGLIPWNIAASAPAFLFSLEPNFMGYAFFLLIAPLFKFASNS